ncbi:MAG TPA: hypothetical protein VJT14_04755 [Candidatus Dormibacteraeota bacterium]|nr:hypothetical protein [Candidatus Dormibacteraeota bacterium]
MAAVEDAVAIAGDQRAAGGRGDLPVRVAARLAFQFCLPSSQLTVGSHACRCAVSIGIGPTPAISAGGAPGSPASVSALAVMTR